MSAEKPYLFISYRRSDNPTFVSLISEKLFPKFEIFLDKLSLKSGMEWEEILLAEIQRCDVLLIIIGPEWTNLLNWKYPDKDYVQKEITIAHSENKIILPVTILDTPVPKPEQLPEQISFLLNIQFFDLGKDDKFLDAKINILSGEILNAVATHREKMPMLDQVPSGTIYTKNARRVIQYAVQKAQNAKRADVTRECLLLGLIKSADDKTVAGELFVNFLQDYYQSSLNDGLLWQKLQGIEFSTQHFIKKGKSYFDEECLTILTLAQEEATQRSHLYIATEHLLIAMLIYRNSAVIKQLIDEEFALKKLRENVESILK